ncbi:hypothetical protein BASA81_007094 [Batrachochytrium salamandrivorans]|nr:hypothetical protein BASA81_007094 [Batrachochytrium salamandrivorans]
MKVNVQVFWQRASAVLDMLASHQKDSASALFQASSLVVWSEKNPEVEGTDAEYANTSRLSLFLMDGFEFPETLFAFAQGKVCISASEKKIKLLQELEHSQPSMYKRIKLELVPRSKDDVSGQCVKRVAQFLHPEADGQQQSAVGLLHKSDQGFAKDLIGEFGGKFTSSKQALEECLLWTKRDVSAIQSTREVCLKLCGVTERFRKSIPDFEDEPRSHDHEVKQLEKLLTSDKEEIDPLTDFCLVQSGGSGFDFHNRVVSKSEVKTDTICVKLGATRKGFCGVVARTVYVDPNGEVKDAYETLLKVRELLVGELKPGAKISEVYEKCIQPVVGGDNGNKWQQMFDLESLGFAIGIGFGTSPGMQISATNGLRVCEKMMFVLNLKLKGLELACEVTDLVLVAPSSSSPNNEVLTQTAKVDWKRSHFRSQDEGAEDETKSSNRKEEVMEAVGPRRTRAQEKSDQVQQKANREQEMGKRQWERIVRKRDLMNKRSESGQLGASGGATGNEEDGPKLVDTYKSPKELPTSETMKRDRIHIDTKHECVLLPLGDRVIPFHVSTIKTVSRIEETAESASIRFNFHFPSSSSTVAQFKDLPPEMAAAIESFPQMCYIKELTFKSRDVQTVGKLVLSVRNLMKQAKERNQKDSDEGSLVQQAALQVLKERPKDKPATLVDVSMFPSFSSRATVGRLRAHINGFRFSVEKLGEVDVLYDNIKYFFYMRGERELKVCVHCYLKNAIMVGKKKTKHVQFYTEVQEGSSDLRGRGGGGYDPDELEDEDRQRRLVQKLNKTFAEFCRQSKEIANNNAFEFEVETVNSEKQRQRGFFGMPYKEMVLIQPTEHCLVNLSEKEPFVLAVDEIEHIHLQRLSIGKIRNFDIVFILKSQLALDRSGDNIKVCKLENVPIEKLDVFRDWIDSHDDLTYTCGEAALKWEPVMDGVRWELDQGFFWKDEDKEGNKKDFGWLFLNPQGLDDESSDGDEDDSNFSSSGGSDEDDGDESEETDDSDVESEVDEDDEDEDGGGDNSSEDEGEDWDELDRKAEQQDRKGKMGRRDEEEDLRERMQKKKSRH